LSLSRENTQGSRKGQDHKNREEYGYHSLVELGKRKEKEDTTIRERIKPRPKGERSVTEKYRVDGRLMGANAAVKKG